LSIVGNLIRITFKSKARSVILLFDKRYGCGACGKTFKDRFQLLEHAEDAHNKNTTYSCITCDESFSSESSFKLHMVRDHKLF
jgi:DNA-directed RNA polymerase subunit RPC12/RpoP